VELGHFRLREPKSDGIALDANFHLTQCFCQNASWLLLVQVCGTNNNQRPLAIFLVLFLRRVWPVRLLVAGLSVRTPPYFALGRSLVSFAHVRYFFMVMKNSAFASSRFGELANVGHTWNHAITNLLTRQNAAQVL
jgi:hypothetical protein